MTQKPTTHIELDGPHYPRKTTLRAAGRWVLAVVLALVAMVACTFRGYQP